MSPNPLNSSTQRPTLRDTLFGDAPDWPPASAPLDAAPWSHFAQAAAHLLGGRTGEAITCWQRILTTPDLESRHYLQAWHFLRQHGQIPTPELAKHVLGVVVEVAMPEGLDILAAYEDLHARYLNHSGAAIIWEARDPAIDQAISTLLAAATRIATAIGPWTKPRPAPPPVGQMRLNILTPSGPHFGQGPFEQLSRDPLAGPAVAAATSLLLALTEKPA